MARNSSRPYLKKLTSVKDIIFALCDVLKACDIKGASDASIANPIPHNIGALIQDSSICRHFYTWWDGNKIL